MKSLKLPEDMNVLTIDGEEYRPDDKGNIMVVESHVKQAISLGAVDPTIEVPEVALILPKEMEEGDADMVRALVAENEAIKREYGDVTSKLRGYVTQIEELSGRIRELEEQLAAAAEPAASDLPTESGDEAQSGEQEDGQTPAEEETPEDASPSAPDFTSMDRDARIAWLKEHGVGVPGNIGDDTLLRRCEETLAQG